MKTSLSKSIVADFIAIAVMTIVMFMAPMMGLPRMNPAEMLSMMMDFSIIIG